MIAAAEAMEFERAAVIRDRITTMRDAIGQPVDAVQEKKPADKRGRRRRGGGKKESIPRPKRGI